MVEQIITWELYKEFKFGHTKKWYMYNPESVQENEMRKLFWDFEIQKDPLISVNRPSDSLQKKKQPAKMRNLPFFSRLLSKIERKRKERLIPRTC